MGNLELLVIVTSIAVDLDFCEDKGLILSTLGWSDGCPRNRSGLEGPFQLDRSCDLVDAMS